MTRYAPLWQQNATFPARTDRTLLSALWPTAGAIGGVPSLVAGTLNVSIAAGSAAVPMTGGMFTELCTWDAAEVVTLGAGPGSGNSRIDLIVCQVRDTAIDSSGFNDFYFNVIAGTPAASNPAAPAVPTNAIAICQVLVPTGVANLNTATLTDLRRTLIPAASLPAPVTTGTAVQSYTDPSGEVWVAKAGVYGGAWKKARDVLHCQYYRTAAFNVTNANVQIVYDTLLAAGSDPYGIYNPANGFMTAPVAGLWQASGAFTTFINSSLSASILLSISGPGIIASSRNVSPVNPDQVIVGPVKASFPLGAGGQTSFWMVSTTTGAAGGTPGMYWTYMSCDYLGTG